MFPFIQKAKVILKLTLIHITIQEMTCKGNMSCSSLLLLTLVCVQQSLKSTFQSHFFYNEVVCNIRIQLWNVSYKVSPIFS